MNRISQRLRSPWTALALVLPAACAVWLLASLPDAGAGDSPGEVLLTYGVGGALTADGTLWQYRPDLDRWFTIDDAFREEGRQTRVLPLPVPAREIAQMSTFGFILTKAGRMWLYEFATDKWREVQAPPGR